jgi:transcriptional regulator with XRE-family HTH domain
MSDFGRELARLMDARGTGVRELARAVPCNPGHVSNLRSGRDRPSPQMAARLDEILDAGGTLAALAPAGRRGEIAAVFNGSLSPDSRERLSYAAKHPVRIDTGAVRSLAAVLEAQRHAEDSLGSAVLVRPVLAQLAVIEELVTEARGPLRPAMVHMGGQWAQFAGWLHANTGHAAEGDRRLSQALQLAMEAGEVNLISEVLSFQGHAAYVAGHPGPVVGLSRAAQRDRSAYPGQLAISAAQEAKGLAMAGDAHDVDRLLEDADELAAKAAGHRQDAPPWLYYHTDGFFDLQRGEAYGYLAAGPHYRARASAALTSGYAALPASAQQSEWGAEYLVRLAAVHALGGDAEQACMVAVRAALIARATGSARLSRMLKRLHANLAAQRPGDGRISELGEALP